jgi:hypothetical protein
MVAGAKSDPSLVVLVLVEPANPGFARSDMADHTEPSVLFPLGLARLAKPTGEEATEGHALTTRRHAADRRHGLEKGCWDD